MATKKTSSVYKNTGGSYLGAGLPMPVAQPAQVAPSYVAPSIYDSTYNAQAGAYGLQRDNTLAQVAAQRKNLASDYGYAGDGFDIDTSNPFGRAQLLARSYQQTQAGNQNSYAARGQQTSGAYQRQVANAAFGNQQQTDALQKSYLAAIGQLTAASTGAVNDYGANVANAGADALNRAIASRAGAVSNQPAAPVNPVVSAYTDAKGNKVNVHADGSKVVVKKK